jgi:hypothetical protein
MHSESGTHLIGEITQVLDVLSLEAFFTLLSAPHFAFLHFLDKPPRSRYRDPVRSWRVIACRSVL